MSKFNEYAYDINRDKILPIEDIVGDIAGMYLTNEGEYELQDSTLKAHNMSAQQAAEQCMCEWELYDDFDKHNIPEEMLADAMRIYSDIIEAEEE